MADFRCVSARKRCVFFHLQSPDERVCESFDEMNLRDSLLRGIYNHGFEKPSPIQARAIMPCCAGTCGLVCNAFTHSLQAMM